MDQSSGTSTVCREHWGLSSWYAVNVEVTTTNAGAAAREIPLPGGGWRQLPREAIGGDVAWVLIFFNGEWNVVEPQNSGASGKQLSELSAANGWNPCLFSISPKNIQNVFCHGESHV